jgi:Uma2 family endonuclease
MSIKSQPTIDQFHDRVQQGAGEQRIVLEGVSWETYRRLAAELGESRNVRLTFAEGELEIMSPDAGHELAVDVLVDLVKVAAEAMDMDWANFGAMTMEHPEFRHAAQPDACFYFTNAARVYGKPKIDLAVDPPPELVIEVDVSSPSAKKQPLYGRLGVTEVWRSGKRLHIYHFGGATYVEHHHSLTFPWLSAAQITSVLAAARRLGPRQARKSFEQWVREQHE